MSTVQFLPAPKAQRNGRWLADLECRVKREAPSTPSIAESDSERLCSPFRTPIASLLSSPASPYTGCNWTQELSMIRSPLVIDQCCSSGVCGSSQRTVSVGPVASPVLSVVPLSSVPIRPSTGSSVLEPQMLLTPETTTAPKLDSTVADTSPPNDRNVTKPATEQSSPPSVAGGSYSLRPRPHRRHEQPHTEFPRNRKESKKRGQEKVDDLRMERGQKRSRKEDEVFRNRYVSCRQSSSRLSTRA